MNKKIVTTLLIIAFAMLFTGCSKKEDNNKTDEEKVNWTVNMDNKALTIPKEAKKAFESATKKYTGMTFEPIALLGTQVVSGKNYMFLCKGTTVTQEPVSSYQIVTIYNDLKNVASVKEVTEFDASKYIGKNIEASNEQLSGGWTVYGKTEAAKLTDNVEKTYNKALDGYTGFSYSPIALLSTSDKNGYAVLVLGKSVTKDVYYTINVLTISNDKLLNNAYVDLADFN